MNNLRPADSGLGRVVPGSVRAIPFFPITVALGHAELIHRESRDDGLTRDAQVVVEELARLRRLADRLLLLAASEPTQPARASSIHPVSPAQAMAAV